MSRWFRLYDCVLDDPKVQRLAPAIFKTWINLLCVASRNDGMLPGVTDLAFMLRMSDENMAADLKALVAAGLIDWDGDDYAPHRWAERQFKSDVSTERVKRFRKRSETVSETPPDTDTDTDTEQKQIDAPRVAVALVVPKKDSKGSTLPKDWTPEPDDLEYGQRLGLTHAECLSSAENMRLWAAAASGQVARKRDWGAAFKGWLRRDADRLKRTPSTTQPNNVHEFTSDEAWFESLRARRASAGAV